MGITIVQKSDLSRKKTHAKTALVLAGGAISGGAFKAGGLKALNDFLVNRKVTDFDTYVGISAGGFLAVPLAGGIPPEEILKILEGNSNLFEQLSPLHLYYPNWREWMQKPLSYFYDTATYFPGLLLDFISSFPNFASRFREGIIRFLKKPSYSNYESMLKPVVSHVTLPRNLPSLFSALPTGLFDNRVIEKYLRENIRKNRMSNNFKVFRRLRRKEVYICATELDTAERVVFGWDENSDVSISEAVMASTALPGFYKPARIKGVDYIDGGVQLTADIDLAVQKGADLIICYNPFRPFKNIVNLEYLKEADRYITQNQRISDSGMFGIFNQVFRTLYHSRLMHGIQRYQDDKNFKGDIILIEPKEDDFTFFDLNPFAFWNRAKGARLGFESVRESIEERFDEIAAILNSYGIQMTREFVSQDEVQLKKRPYDAENIMNVLEDQSPRRALRVIAGGERA